MSFHYRYRKQIILGIIILVILGIISYFSVNYYLKNKKSKKENKEIVVKKISKEKYSSKETKKMLLVDIKGEVYKPGIYELEESARVIDVINKAGGLTENANTTVINLSKKIIDEMVIIIYSNAEVEDFTKTKEKENLLIDACKQKDENSLTNDACIDKDNDKTLSGKISINTASVEELMKLPGIGESKAKSIIEYRNTNGPFNSIEDIMKVTGIGENLFAQIKEFITL